MEEQEERILVLTTHNKDGECECVMQDGCHANDSCDICNVGMTRQEAINRMTKAIYTFEIIACSHDECGNKQCENCETWKWCKNISEAALNALLEGK